MKRRWFIHGISSSALFLSLPPLLDSCTKEPPISEDYPTDNPQDSKEYNSLSDTTITTLSQNQFELIAETALFELFQYQLNGYSINKGYPSPTIRTSKGKKLTIDFINQIGTHCIIHWHGLIVPPEMDGHPSLAISSGSQYHYEFEINQRAGTYFYHSHTHGLTANQVYSGIAGFFIIEDQEEAALNLPSGANEIPLLIQDKRTTTSKEVVYAPTQMEYRMEGYLGDTPFVNGVPNAKHQVNKGVYRLRILNGSNARIYSVAWSNQMEFTLIGTDGGLLENPVHLKNIILAPAERIDVLVDFSKINGSEVGLISTDNDLIKSSSGGMMGSSFAQGTPFDLLVFEVQNQNGATYQLPSKLSTITYPDQNSAQTTRKISLEMIMQMGHSINGKQYQSNQIEFEVPQGAVEIWEFTNTTNVAHPMHLHGVQFKVIYRSGRGVQAWEEGLKDTVLVLPSEVVQILVHFTAQPGLYLFHCHNLEHEDAGMMLNYAIV